MIYGYAWDITNKAQKSITNQIKELESQGIDIENIYQDCRGLIREERIELNRLLIKLRYGDTVVASQMFRITSNAKELCELIKFAEKMKLRLILGAFIVDCSKNQVDEMTKGILKMSTMCLEMENSMISIKIRNGIKNAKASGKSIGRPVLSIDDIPNVFLKYYPKYQNSIVNITELAQLCNMSRSTIYKYIRLCEKENNRKWLQGKIDK